MGRADLKLFYETNDVPTELQFGQFIDEAAHLQDDLITQAEAEAGTATTVRTWSALRVWQAIAAALQTMGLTTQTITDAAHTVSDTDFGKFTLMDKATDQTITFPTNAVDPLAVNKSWQYQKVGDGDVYVSAPGVTVDAMVDGSGNHVVTLKGGHITIRKTDTNRISIYGNLDHIKMVDIT